MKKNIASSILVIMTLLISGIGNAQESSLAQLKDGLEAILYCKKGETTLEREKRKENSLNRYYIFRGSVNDVETENDIEIMLSPGHYANVRFIKPIASSLRKGQVISIKGALTFIGTGILINHDIKDALIIPDDSATEANERESKNQNAIEDSVEFNASVEDRSEKKKSETLTQASEQENPPPQDNYEFSGYIYFAAEKPPVGKDSPTESPLCYKFKVASMDEQLSKLQNKYGSKFQGEITTESNGHKMLAGNRTDENNNYISYKYFTNPDACNTFQTVRSLTVPEELKSQDIQGEVINASSIEEYINENYAEYKNDLDIETIEGVNNAKIYLIYFNHDDYCGTAGCNLIVASDVGGKVYMLWDHNVYNYKVLSNLAIRLDLHRSYCNQPDVNSCEYTFKIINNNKLELKSVR